MKIVGIVLAAGASERAGFPKALATLDGETFVARMVRTLRGSGCDEVLTIVGAPHADAISLASADARIVPNATPELGMLSSLRAGLTVALADDCDAAVIALVDHPRVRVATVLTLVDAWRTSGALRVRPVHAGRAGHPYVLSRAAFERVLSADAALTTRDVLAMLGAPLDVEVDDAGVLEDLDTAAAILAATGKPPKGSEG